jgi:D-cysteine desulfhydrase
MDEHSAPQYEAKHLGQNSADRNALFERFPAVRDRLPWRSLGRYPTPVQELEGPTSGARLFVKRDDLSSTLYGGNKVRKLEFLLAEAATSGGRGLITLGGIGSNHALATALHGREAGFTVDLVLYDQPLSRNVERNLGGFLEAGAMLHHAGSTARAFVHARNLYTKRRRAGAFPYFIPVGGTSRLGCVGHVSGALELAEQVHAGALPEPDILFVALGTSGTAAGLIAGLKLAGLRTRVAAVQVADRIAANSVVVRFFAQRTLDWLRSLDPAVPPLRVTSDDFQVLSNYFGRGYGHSTPAAEEALRSQAGNLSLETTYTGKALAACLDFCRSCPVSSTVLFWNTFNSAPVRAPADWGGLPESLRHVIAPTLR